jgi:hypothetical protein
MPLADFFSFLRHRAAAPARAEDHGAEPVVSPVTSEPAPTKSASELVADAMASLRQRLRDAETQPYQQHQLAIADAKARIDAAKTFCEKTGIGYAVAAICEAVSPGTQGFSGQRRRLCIVSPG